MRERWGQVAEASELPRAAANRDGVAAAWAGYRALGMPSEIPPSLRRSLLAPLEAGGRAAEVERRIDEAIELGVLSDGEQLPSETELAAALGVAPVTLREALAGLRRRGLVETRRGRGGGTFVRGSEDAQRRRLLARLAARSVDQLRDLCDEHVALGAAAAALASERALPADLARLDAHVAALAQARGERAVRAADSRFHIELAVAARSLRLAKALARIQADVAGLTWTLPGAERAAHAAREHRAILDAVRTGDAAAAAARMRRHLEREVAALAERRLALYGEAPSANGRRRPASRAAMASALRAVEQPVEQVFVVLADARAELARALTTDGGERSARSLERAHAALLAELVRSGGLVSGAGLALDRTAPPAADGRWWWWRTAPDSGEPVPLPVERDRAHPEFYDYESAAWYAVPHASGSRAIVGPFVDYGAEDEHIFTLGEPIPALDAGAPLGVVGADVPVARVEAVAVPALLALGGEATLLSGDGVVIASSGARWLPGRPWDRRRLARLGGMRERWAIAGEDRLLLSRQLGWALVVTAR